MKPSGQIIARQRREYAAVPSADRTAKTLTFFEGFYVRGKKKFNYTKPKDPSVPGGVDQELLEGLTDGLVDDKSSRDGIPKRLFRLTSQELQYYRFRLLGVDQYHRGGGFLHTLIQHTSSYSRGGDLSIHAPTWDATAGVRRPAPG